MGEHMIPDSLLQSDRPATHELRAHWVPIDLFLRTLHSQNQYVEYSLSPVLPAQHLKLTGPCCPMTLVSAINFNATVEKVEKEGAEYVKLTFLGKFLPYTRW